MLHCFTTFCFTLVVAEKPEYLTDAETVLTNPLLIVEVLSPGTEEFDRGTKFEEYKSIPSFQEYVLISQKQPYVTAYFRKSATLWQIETVTDAEATVDFRSGGCALALKDMYEDVNFDQDQ